MWAKATREQFENYGITVPDTAREIAYPAGSGPEPILHLELLGNSHEEAEARFKEIRTKTSIELYTDAEMEVILKEVSEDAV